MHLRNYDLYNQYYDFYTPVFQNNNQYKDNELITFYEAIELIKVSINDELEDELFYNELINNAPSEIEKEIIKGIRNDEREHNKILRDLYFQFTGKKIPFDEIVKSYNKSLNYKEGIEKAFFGELNAVAKYRKILGTMPSGDSYTLLMSIMTDELIHANKYNYLINKLNIVN